MIELTCLSCGDRIEVEAIIPAKCPRCFQPMVEMIVDSNGRLSYVSANFSPTGVISPNGDPRAKHVKDLRWQHVGPAIQRPE